MSFKLAVFIFFTSFFCDALSLKAAPIRRIPGNKNHVANRWKSIRGGQQDGLQDQGTELKSRESTAASTIPPFSLVAGVLSTAGKVYSQQLQCRPILTKSFTAGFIFGLSDYLAQKIEVSSERDTGIQNLNLTRMLVSSLVGLLYFGPAAHYWYEMIFRLLPGSGILSTIYKAFWGQAVFGPSFTCVFFAASLLQTGNFSLSGWFQKIRTDLPGAWLAGAGYWPLVDLISYSVVPIKWIPLFINLCSLIWTVYLSLVANKD